MNIGLGGLVRWRNKKSLRRGFKDFFMRLRRCGYIRNVRNTNGSVSGSLIFSRLLMLFT